NLSTGETVTSDAICWKGGETKADSMTVGMTSATLKLRNPDYKYTAPALRGSFVFNPVKIWFAYPGAQSILIFSGFISEVSSINDWITLNCTRNHLKRYPAVKIRPPIANHLPANGQVIHW